MKCQTSPLKYDGKKKADNLKQDLKHMHRPSETTKLTQCMPSIY
jgi:hypothetical protein